MNHLLTPPVRTFLEEPRFAVFATINKDGSPHLTVLWYLLEEDTVLLNTAQNRQKTPNIGRDPRVAMTVEEGYTYVSLYGTATLVMDQTIAQADIRRLAIRYRGENVGNQMADELFQNQQRITIRMRVERVVAMGFEE